jgi:hypothetical protein
MKFPEILIKLKSESFSYFSFKIHFESKEVSMEKVVPLFNPFKTIFYFNFYEQGKVLFESIKVWRGLKLFEFIQIFKPV